MANDLNQKILMTQDRLETAFDNLEKVILNKIDQLFSNIRIIV